MAEKVQCHINQTWLEYGPSLESVRMANRDVRQVLTDMGTELGMADYADVAAQCIGIQPESSVAIGQSWLFPNAFAALGLQRILDGVIRSGLTIVPFWPNLASIC